VHLVDVPVSAPSRAREDFEHLPFAVYAGNHWWAPASTDVVAALLRDAERGRADLLPVLAVHHGRPVARAAAVLEPSDPVAGSTTGWIGLVECLPGEAPAGVAAIDRCAQWLQERGVEDPSAPGVSALVSGLLLDGFDRPQTFLTPYNPAWYLGLWEAAGFRVSEQMLAVQFTRDRVPRFPSRPPHGVRIRSVRVDRLEQDLSEIAAFQAEVFHGRPGHRHRSLEQMTTLADDLGPGVDPDLVLLAEDLEGTTVGVLVCLVDAWQRDPPASGPDRARLLSIGVSHGWRGRRLALALGEVLTRRLLDKGYQSLEGSWIRQDNTRARAVARGLGARETRRFAVLTSR
jgi:hypothetical protein